ncbi:transcriptional regulator [Rhodovibrio sodomensis]|uniref:Transcriptional regulator n=1 Tax=Rhodovibrio sodomensis TaxID=1088 RepID=A0ABS1DQ13_9PROT|nr:helix-turn-helix transcriptional regulator [Rhodovibrio sodomensis]MBK1671420.1 transcriptional regulator [Rhodovibrio sodomensis]
MRPEQCRAARAILGWSQSDLAEASLVGRRTLANFENGTSALNERTKRDIQLALERAGIVFIDPNGGGPGVRLRDNTGDS